MKKENTAILMSDGNMTIPSEVFQFVGIKEKDKQILFSQDAIIITSSQKVIEDNLDSNVIDLLSQQEVDFISLADGISDRINSLYLDQVGIEIEKDRDFGGLIEDEETF